VPQREGRSELEKLERAKQAVLRDERLRRRLAELDEALAQTFAEHGDGHNGGAPPIAPRRPRR
jgi:hypothetical protein